jgi:hypothetical protein
MVKQAVNVFGGGNGRRAIVEQNFKLFSQKNEVFGHFYILSRALG